MRFARIACALLVAVTTLSFTAAPAFADEERTLVIKDHRFTPDTVEISANTRTKLIIDNQDATPEEFESHALHIEKVIAPKSKGVVRIGPLKPGTYNFVGEFHEDTARGKIVVK